MKTSDMLQQATLIAFNRHDGQTDKAGRPYFIHPFHVAMDVLSQTDDNELAAAAILHDVIEDTDLALEDLYTYGMSDRVVDTVAALTRNKHEDYLIYLARLSTNDDARTIKIADLIDNLNEHRLSLLPEQVRNKLARKYRAALYLLKKQK